MQLFLDRFLLNPLAALTDKWSDRIRDLGFVTSYLLLLFTIWVDRSGLHRSRYLVVFSLGCLFLALMALFLLRAPVRKTRFRWLLPLLLLFGALQLVSGIVNRSADYLPEAVLILFGLPVVYLSWSGVGYERVFRLLSVGSRLSLLLYALGCILFSPFFPHYTGLHVNPNNMSQYLMTPFCFTLYSLLLGESRRERVTSQILMGFCGALLFYSNSRTGQLTVLLVLVCTVIVCLIRRELPVGQLLLRAGLCLASAALFTVALVPVFRFVASLGLPTAVDFGIVPSYGNIYEEMELDMDEIVHVMGAKFALIGRTLDQISAGRISVWGVFLEDLNWTGHEAGYQLYVKSRWMYYSTAHNAVLQAAYDHGKAAGLCLLLLQLSSVVLSIRQSIRLKSARVALLPAMLTAAYFLTALLASVSICFYYSLLLHYYFALGALADRDLEERDLRRKKASA